MQGRFVWLAIANVVMFAHSSFLAIVLFLCVMYV